MMADISCIDSPAHDTGLTHACLRCSTLYTAALNIADRRGSYSSLQAINQNDVHRSKSSFSMHLFMHSAKQPHKPQALAATGDRL